MRILMFGWEFPPNISGGLGTACYGLCEELVKLGHKITFVMPNSDIADDSKENIVRVIDASDVEVSNCCKIKDEIFRKIDFIRIGSNILPYSSPEQFEEIAHVKSELDKCEDSGDIWNKRYRFEGGYGANLMKEVARYAVVAAEIAEKLKNEIDVIHCHDWLTYLAGIEAKKVLGVKLVVHVHATQYDRVKSDNQGAVYKIEKEGMQKADMVVAVSNYTKKIVVEKYEIPESKVEVVHNGVVRDWMEIRQSKIIDNVKVVTFMGRITYQKGPEYFVEMAYQLLKFNDDVRFVMSGSGDLLDKMKDRVEQLGMTDKFIFTGFLDKNGVQEVFALTDVYVMPSVSEPFGISLLEAMLSRIPVVISKQSGVSEVVRDAIKVDYWDIDAMANAVNGILSYAQLSDFMIQYGLEEAKNITWNSAAQKMTTLYKKLNNKYRV